MADADDAVGLLPHGWQWMMVGNECGGTITAVVRQLAGVVDDRGSCRPTLEDQR
jgi:hypothetical protein